MQLKKNLVVVFAALLLLGAAFGVTAQRKSNRKPGATKNSTAAPQTATPVAAESPVINTELPVANKRNQRPVSNTGTDGNQNEPAGNVSAPTNNTPQVGTQNTNEKSQADELEKYVYEFSQPEFFISHLIIMVVGRGHGTFTFQRKTLSEPIVEAFDLSPAALARIDNLWQALNFLNTAEDYQTPRQYPHLGTISLRMVRGNQDRSTQFNWTANNTMNDLLREYRRIADQALFVFDINLARTLQPLDAPKLMDRLEKLVKSDGLSDTQQVVPLLRELAVDERIPLIARNRADKILQIIAKAK